jgi:hypothetical protein
LRNLENKLGRKRNKKMGNKRKMVLRGGKGQKTKRHW